MADTDKPLSDQEAQLMIDAIMRKAGSIRAKMADQIKVNAQADAQLTDHEWWLKMAAEGKALYLPGKTVEEMKAAMEERKMSEATLERRSIELKKAEWAALDMAIPNLIEVLHDTRRALEEYGNSIGYSIDPGPTEVAGFMRLVARAIQSMNEEIQLIDRLDTVIRHSSKGDAP